MEVSPFARVIMISMTKTKNKGSRKKPLTITEPKIGALGTGRPGSTSHGGREADGQETFTGRN